MFDPEKKHDPSGLYALHIFLFILSPVQDLIILMSLLPELYSISVLLTYKNCPKLNIHNIVLLDLRNVTDVI